MCVILTGEDSVEALPTPTTNGTGALSNAQYTLAHIIFILLFRYHFTGTKCICCQSSDGVNNILLCSVCIPGFLEHGQKFKDSFFLYSKAISIKMNLYPDLHIENVANFSMWDINYENIHAYLTPSLLVAVYLQHLSSTYVMELYNRQGASIMKLLSENGIQVTFPFDIEVFRSFYESTSLTQKYGTFQDLMENISTCIVLPSMSNPELCTFFSSAAFNLCGYSINKNWIWPTEFLKLCMNSEFFIIVQSVHTAIMSLKNKPVTTVQPTQSAAASTRHSPNPKSPAPVVSPSLKRPRDESVVYAQNSFEFINMCLSKGARYQPIELAIRNTILSSKLSPIDTFNWLFRNSDHSTPEELVKSLPLTLIEIKDN